MSFSCFLLYSFCSRKISTLTRWTCQSPLRSSSPRKNLKICAIWRSFDSRICGSIMRCCCALVGFTFPESNICHCVCRNRIPDHVTCNLLSTSKACRMEIAPESALAHTHTDTCTCVHVHTHTCTVASTHEHAHIVIDLWSKVFCHGRCLFKDM